MKRALPYLLLPILLVFSCKKEHSAQPPKTYKVSYNVSGFTQTIIGSTVKQKINSLPTNAVTGLAASADFLYYRVYGFTSGALVHQINQDSSFANFGSLVDYLPAGKYIVAFVASKPGIVFNNGNGSNLYYGADIKFAYPETSWPDTFYQKDTLTVTGEDVNQTVNLKRIVGQLTIKLLDVFPANASKLNIFVSQENNGFSIASSAVDDTTTLTFSDVIPASLKTTAGYQRSIFMMNKSGPFSVTVTCYDAGNNILAQSVITGVNIAWDTQTILTGNLFATGAGFNVGLNLPFDPNPITVQF